MPKIVDEIFPWTKMHYNGIIAFIVLLVIVFVLAGIFWNAGSPLVFATPYGCRHPCAHRTLANGQLVNAANGQLANGQLNGQLANDLVNGEAINQPLVNRVQPGWPVDPLNPNVITDSVTEPFAGAVTPCNNQVVW